MIRSSTNRPHLWVLGPHLTPAMFVFVRMAIAKNYIVMAKIGGDDGQPWRVPLAISMGSE